MIFPSWFETLVELAFGAAVISALAAAAALAFRRWRWGGLLS
jgi:hypothetical protein